MRMTRIAGSQSCYESPGCEIPWLSRTVDKSMRFCILQTCALVRVNRGGLSPFTSGRKSLCRLQHLKLKVMQALAFHTQSQISKLWEVWRSPIMNFSTNLVLDYNVVREFEKDRAIMNVLWMAVFFDRENCIFLIWQDIGVEATFWKSFYISKAILEVISGLEIFQKRFSIISWIECTNARRGLLVDLMKPLKGLWCRVSWSPNSTVLHLDIYLHKYTNLKDTAGQSASAVYNCTMRRIANSAQYTKCWGGLLR